MNKLIQRLWPLGIIFILCIFFSFPYWGKGLVPFPSTYLVTFFTPWSQTHGMPVKNNAMPDVITQIFPWKRLTIDTWKQGSLPLWNPYSFSGTPHAGNYQSAVFSPMNVLFLLFPKIHAWSLLILLQPLFAGIFMYLFLRSLMVSKEGSVLGSIGFMFSGFMVVWMAYGTLGYAVLGLPLILFALTSYRNTKKVGYLSLVAIALGWSFFSGHFQMSLYVLLFTMAFLLYFDADFRKKSIPFVPFLFVALGVGISAIQILPSLASYAEAGRSGLFMRGEIIPWKYLPTVLSPDYFGNPVTRNDWFGHYAEWASYIGVIPFFLAILAMTVGWKSRTVRFFAGAALVSLLLAYESPLSELLFMMRIPVLSTSAASRIVLLFSFSLASLSGIGLDRLKDLWKTRSWRNIQLFAITLVVLIGVFFLVTVLKITIPAEKVSISMRNSILPLGFSALLCGIIAVGFWLPVKMQRVLPFLLLLIAGFDSFRFASKWMPFDPISYFYPDTVVVRKLQQLTSGTFGRVFGNIGGEVGVTYGIPLIDGYDAVYQHRYGRFISSVHTGVAADTDRSVVVFDKHGKFSEQVLQLLGVRYYIHKKSDGQFPWAYPYWEYPNYSLLWEDPNFAIYENTKAFPRAFLASSYEIGTNEQDILRRLYAKPSAWRDHLILEQKPAIEPQVGEGNATITVYTPEDIHIQTESQVPKLLFLSDVYADGWHVSVDGKEQHLLRADMDFRAVAISEGKHTVRLWYFPISLVFGMFISGCSLIGVILGMIRRKT